MVGTCIYGVVRRGELVSAACAVDVGFPSIESSLYTANATHSMVITVGHRVQRAEQVTFSYRNIAHHTVQLKEGTDDAV